MIAQAGLYEAFSNLPIHIDFRNDDNFIINTIFMGALGGAVGILLSYIVREIFRIIND